MKKKVLIIGFGSIGLKHAKILSRLNLVSKVAILTKQKKIKLKKTIFIKNLSEFNPDYIFVCSKTSDHYFDILKIEKKYKNKIVLIEKPLFEKNRKIKVRNNKYFVGYNLRFNPVLNYLKHKIKKKKIFSINIKCSSYLPYWRKRNYVRTYSSIKENGGGVILDLSHELDYVQWLFGKLNRIEIAKINKLSYLKLNVEDNAIICAKINSINVLINLNFYSRVNERTLILDGKNFSLKADLLNNYIKIFKDKKEKTIFFKSIKNSAYLKQNVSLLKNNFNNICTFKEGLEIMKLINKIYHASK